MNEDQNLELLKWLCSQPTSTLNSLRVRHGLKRGSRSKMITGIIAAGYQPTWMKSKALAAAPYYESPRPAREVSDETLRRRARVVLGLLNQADAILGQARRTLDGYFVRGACAIRDAQLTLDDAAAHIEDRTPALKKIKKHTRDLDHKGRAKVTLRVAPRTRKMCKAWPNCSCLGRGTVEDCARPL